MLISLCVAGLTAAAPQLGLPRTVNQNVIVNDVVTTLQPTIASAVANALAALNPAAPAFDAERAQFEAEFANRNKAGANQAAVGAAAPAKAEYNFQYQVRDDKEGTYIYQQEARDGNDVNGVYGFIDPNGDLVTVNYLAGLEGFSQTVDKEENYLGGGSRSATSAASSGSNFGSSPASNNFESSSSSNNSGSGSSSNNSGSSLSSSTDLDEAALVAQILSVLQPEITASVNRVIAG